MKIDFCKKWIVKCTWSIIFALLLFVFFLFALAQHINPIFAIFNIVFIFFVLILVGKIKNKFLQAFCAFFVSLLLSINITFSLCFSAPIRLGNIASILETNLSEILLLDWKLYCLGLICLLLTTILTEKVILELKSTISGLKAGIILLSLIIFINLVAVFVPFYNNPSVFQGYKKDLREQPLQTIYAFSSLRLPLLYADFLALVVYSIEKLDFQRFRNAEKKLPSGLLFEPTKNSIPTIYLVVGESAYRGRMSLYGYEMATTPFLDSIAQTDSLSIDHYDAVAFANLTRDAIRYSLSFANPSDKDAFWREKNIVELAKEAGYETTWLSNQEQAGLYDNYPSYIARSSDEVYFESNLKKDDLDLIPVLENYHGKDKKQLIVFHLMGSHFPYKERSDEEDDSYFADKNYISDHYNKSIHHTDRFLKELYNYTKKEDSNSIIVYYSDHGAVPKRGVHGLEKAESSEYEIPLVILQHNSELNADSLVAKYYSGENSKFINNLNLPYILSELMGYSVCPEIISSAACQGNKIMLVDGSFADFEKVYQSDGNED